MYFRIVGENVFGISENHNGPEGMERLFLSKKKRIVRCWRIFTFENGANYCEFCSPQPHLGLPNYVK